MADAALQAWELAHAWRLLPALQTISLSDEAARLFAMGARLRDDLCA